MDAQGRNAAGELGSYTFESRDERSVGAVIKDIVDNLQSMVRDEIQLARIEISAEIGKLRSAAVMFGAGALLGVFGVGFLLLTIMFALMYVVPNWAAALIVGVLLCICAGAGVAIGRTRIKALRPPVKTMQTIKEDVQWMKEQPRS